MNDSQLTNIQETLAKLTSAEMCLDAVCKDCKDCEECKAERDYIICYVNQARVRIIAASYAMNEILKRRKECIK